MAFLTTLALSLIFVIEYFGHPTTDHIRDKDKLASLDVTVAKTREIPLHEIWAFDMPGTRDVRELEPSKYGPKIEKLPASHRSLLDRKSLTSQIRAALPHLPAHSLDRPKAGFAVQGKRKAVLHGAQGVLATNLPPLHRFVVGGDMNVVFFAHTSGVYTHLRRVEVSQKRLKIVFQFVAHPNRMLTNHFALIPVGKLPPGTYTVEMIQSPDEKSDDAFDRPVNVAPETAHRIVCESFSFVIDDPPEEK